MVLSEEGLRNSLHKFRFGTPNTENPCEDKRMIKIKISLIRFKILAITPFFFFCLPAFLVSFSTL